MGQVTAIAIGGAAGALLRYWVSSGVYALLGRGFPYGTLAVNVLGSLSIGVLSVVLVERLSAGPGLRAALLIGFLGSFTTFSTFSIETLNLIEQREHLRAAVNILVSVLACLSAAWFGVIIGRQI